MQVNFIVPLWNRGNDLLMLLENLKGVDCKILVIDHNSTDIVNYFHPEKPTWNDIKKEYKNVMMHTNPNLFNWAQAIQLGVNQIINTSSIVVLTDADTVFDNPKQFIKDIRAAVQEGKTYFCPNVGTEAKPTKWQAKFNGRCWVPTEDPRGAGLIACYKSDFQRSGGFCNTEFMGARGQEWGGADVKLMERLDWIGLTKIRPTLSNVWLRKNDRDSKNKWYSKTGGDGWYETKDAPQ